MRENNRALAWIAVYLGALAFFSKDWETPIDPSLEISKLTEELNAADNTQMITSVQRRLDVAKYCRDIRAQERSLKSRNWIGFSIYQKPRLYFNDQLEFIVCETPKCGSTQWRNLMLLVDGYIKGYAAGDEDNFELSWDKNFLWKRFDASEVPTATAANRRLRKYYKVMVTREPLERLVSAYRDKLETEKNPVYIHVSKRIHETISPYAEKGLATFEEFIDYILLTKNPADLDPHWRPYSTLCDPCNIHYDYIAKMETIYSDTAVITEHIGVARDRIFNEANGKDLQRRRNTLYREYFLNIPQQKRVAIFNYFKQQYDMFGYDYPDFIQHKAMHVDGR